MEPAPDSDRLKADFTVEVLRGKPPSAALKVAPGPESWG
jgi:hypothetical protein